MSYTITTIQHHKNAIESGNKSRLERLERQVDIGDCAMSNWGNDTMNRFHNMAIRLLELGLETCGEEKPYSHFLTLVDEDDNIVSTQLGSNSFHGTESFYWILNDEMESLYGRKFIPSSTNSRIQRKLCLKEVKILSEAKNHVRSHCAFMGGSVSLQPIRA